MPNGMKINYHDLRYENGEMVYDYGGVTKKLYAQKCYENIVQGLDRVFVMQAWLAISKRCPEARLVNQVHDEIVLIVPQDLAEEYKAVALEEMRRRPVWGPDLPLDAEAHVGSNFGACK
jgi:DNA polymerase I-like protein with 3'-5' exonuclease and polymerase domains